ncbi:MAG: adenylate kinase [Oscillospiraceae bacterium]|jgi:adenylate kinase|nr:adenylate kinase [Oscillospiraceae bacterium]
MKLIFLGAPGAGKGTHAKAVSEKLDIPTISTGNIIREAIKQETMAGLKARAFVEKGRLVPDGIVIEMLKERLSANDCENGYILDGFPRNTAQAEALDSMGVVIDRVLDLEVEDHVIEERLTGRRVCESCGASYHVVYNPSLKGDHCAECGGRLITRPDDAPEVVKDRLRVYHEQTEPLKGYYKALGKLFVAVGADEVSETTRRVFEALEAKAP